MTTMGLMGAQNPIFQASQNMLEQSGQAKNMAIQGIINQHIQTESKKIAAQMEAASVMAQAKDPAIRKMGLTKLIQLGGKEPIPELDQRLDEAATATADLMKFSQNLKDPDAIKEVWNNYLSRFGTDYISDTQTKDVQGQIESLQTQQESFRQGQLQAEALGIPSDSPDYMAMIQGDEKTRGVVTGKMKPSKQIERTVDLGDQVEYIYADGTRETKPKGISPGVDLQNRRLLLMEEREGRKIEAETKKEAARVSTALTKADLVTEKIDKALEQSGILTTGLAGKVLSNVPGTSAYDLDKTIDTIRANIGFQELADMRAASPTGGALGQIAVRELEFLQAALGSLELGQSREQLVDTLQAIKTHYQNWKNTVENAKGAMPQPAPVPQRRATDKGGVRKYNPATGRIE